MNGSRRNAASEPIGSPRPRAKKALSAALLLAFAVVSATGCGDGKIQRFPTSGSVLVEGKPVEGARVMLVPVGGSEAFQKERPFGITDADGKFQLTTFVKGDGAPAGQYNVMIRNGSPKSAEEAKRRSKQPRVGRQYGKPTTSGISVTIEAKENVLEPFELEPAPKSTRRR